MTEDEAFIRAIVDSPGDDTPRLVYADWLDDRSDPRGPYLRAELDWARTGKGVKKLTAMASTLDRLWALRVSRPPCGACLRRKVFTETGPRLTIEQLTNGSLSAPVFPVEYQAFLLNYNGGFLESPLDGVEGFDGDGSGCWMWRMDAFACLRPYQKLLSKSEELVSIRKLAEGLIHPNGCDGILPDYTPIGFSRGDFDSYYLVLLGSGRDSLKDTVAVYYYDNPRCAEWDEASLETLDEDDESDDPYDALDNMDVETRLHRLAGSFLRFLADHFTAPDIDGSV